MKRRILITGTDSGLKAKLIKIFLDNNFKVAATINLGQEGKKSGNNSFIEIPWNRRSPLSAKNIILECINNMGGFDEVLTLFSSEHNNKPLHEISSSEIENAIDSNLKSSLFILKEVILHFQKTGSGNISLINDIHQGEIPAPLFAVESGALQTLAKSLFVSYQNEELNINAFTSNAGELDDYVNFLYKNIGERAKAIHGKTLKFQDKKIPFFLS